MKAALKSRQFIKVIEVCSCSRSESVVSEKPLSHMEAQKQEEIKSPEPRDRSQPLLAGCTNYALGRSSFISAALAAFPNGK